MIIINLILFLTFLFILIKCADYSIKYSIRLARILHFPEFIVSFFIIAIISVLPESTISIISAFNGHPEIGFGTLIGSNVADLTLVFGIVALFSSRGIKVKSKILRDNFVYLILLLFPLILGVDGEFSRIDGLILILLGTLFFIRLLSETNKFHKKLNNSKDKSHFIRNISLLVLSLVILITSAFYTVKFATNFASDVKVPAILIGITIISLGTCLPELIFSIKAVKKNHDSLALGDLLGTVVTDATIILGLVALISPFSYNPINIYVTGAAMFLAGIAVTIFMRTNKTISKSEGLILILMYLIFISIEFITNAILY